MAAERKRDLYEELKQGIEEIKSYQKGKITLRHYKVKSKPLPKVDADFIRDTRKAFHMSRNVFARMLRVSPRTLEKWEQGETVPNAQASALILMVRKYPDTLKRLEKI